MRYMSEIAMALGKHAAAADWSEKFAAAQVAFHTRFYNSTVGGYAPCVNDIGFQGKSSCHGTSSSGSQTSDALALAIGAPPDANTAALVAANIAKDVFAFGNRTTAGITGYANLFSVMDLYGFDRLALEVL